MTTSTTPALDHDGTDSLDPFASGHETRLRLWFARFGAWLFAPPFLPAVLIPFPLLLIAAYAALVLVRKPTEYWIKKTEKWVDQPLLTGLAAGFDWSPLITLLLYLVACGLALVLLNRVLAFALWIILSVGHISDLAGPGLCGIGPFLLTSENETCVAYRTGLLLIFALLFAATFSAALGLIRSTAGEDHRQRLPIILAANIVLLALLIFSGVEIALSAYAPKPRWEQLQPAHSPEGRYGPGFAYDTYRSRAVLFGGASTSNENGSIGRNDTWEWDGHDWIEMKPLISPPPRLVMASAFDSNRKVMVIFGGKTEEITYSDTWEWDGEQWIEQHPTHNPEPRCCVHMVYDSLLEKVILYAGYTTDKTPPDFTTRFYSDAWAWDGQDWQQIPLPDEKYNAAFSMVYSPFHHAPLVMDAEGLFLIRDGQIFQPSFGDSPAGRVEAPMAVHPDLDALFLFGGMLENERYNDTWIYKDDLWRPLTLARSPTPRNYAFLFYDKVRGQMVLHGGGDGEKNLNETWELILP